MTAPRKSASGIRRPASGITIDTERLVRMREEEGWGPADLAEEAGLSPSTISKIENRERRPSAAALGAICDALGCQPVDLLPAVKPKRRTA
jgi:transcriptional regulator with XRE-family HTH domain